MKLKITAALLKAIRNGWLKVYLMCALLCVSLSARAVNYYVSENGDDRNTGTSAQTAFRTIQRAHNQTAPGDVVYIMNGTYTPDQESEILKITRSGNANGYITYRNMPGHTPVLYVAKERASWNAILIDNARYIVIEGLELRGDNDRITLAEGEARYTHYATGGRNWTYLAPTNTNGIYIRGNFEAESIFGPTHIIIRNNRVHKFPGGGIASRVVDHVTIEGNVTHSNAWYSIYANSGISIFNPWNSDGNQGFKIFVRRNISYRNETYVRWMINNTYSDGNGIIIDNTTNSQINRPAYTGRIRVENNVSYENGGSGIHSFSSGRTEIVNNTVYNNALSTRQTGYYNIGAHESRDVIIRNNISSFASGRSTAWHNNNSGNQNVVYDHNIYHNGGTPRVMGTNDNRLNPNFVNVGQRNFQLQPSSPAINTGSSSLAPGTDFAGVSRPQGGGFDRGAYEYAAGNLLANPGFENGTNPWTGNGGTLAQSTAQKRAGTYAGRITSRTAFWAGPVQDITSLLIANGQGTYNISAWLRKESDTGTGQVTIKLTYGGANHYRSVSATYTSTTWTQLAGNVSITWSGTLTRAEFYVETPGNQDNFFVDDCSLVKFSSARIGVFAQTEILPDDLLLAFPNPASDKLTIRLPEELSTNATLTVVSPEGKNLLMEKMKTNEHQIQVGEYPAGLYVIRVQSNRGQLSRKFIKQ
jgi:hypothetical protein